MDRPLVVALRRDRAQLPAHDAAPRRRARRGGGRRRPARQSRPTSATSRRRRARFVELPARRLARRCGRRLHAGPSSPRRSSRRRGSTCRVRRISSADWPAAGTAARVLGAPQREGRADAAALARGAARLPRPAIRAWRRAAIRWRATRFLTTWIARRAARRGLGRDLRDRALARVVAGRQSVEKLEHGDDDGVGALYRHELAQRPPVHGPLRDADDADRAADLIEAEARRRARRHRPLALLRRRARPPSPTSGTCTRRGRG